jgi:hypothetical protein
VVLLFTGRYPTSVFDLVLGINRWALRVAAYVTLMTDQYPPFRLDLGGSEPPGTMLSVSSAPPTGDAGTGVSPTSSPVIEGPAPGAPAPGAPGGRSWGTGRIVSVVLGALLFLVAGGLLTVAATGAIASSTLRDGEGYLMSPAVSVSSSGSAVVSQTMELRSGTSVALPERLIGDLKARVDDRTSQPVFIGVARADDAATYLADVGYSTVLDPTAADGRPSYQQHSGGLPTSRPSKAGIWVASSIGTGRQTVTWPAREGQWTLVLMNADGSRGVGADVAVGATVPGLGGVLTGLFVLGGVLMAVSIVVLVLSVRRPNQR